MAAYRLADLAERSGVTARNIRSYQERGLLAPPRREGRSAVYDDDHLAQLGIITALLGKGYTIAHIQDFFEGFANDLQLADVLGVQRLAEQTGMREALMGPWTAAAGGPSVPTTTLRLDPSGDFTRRLVESGIVDRDGDDLVVVDPAIAELVAGAKDPHFYLRIALGVHRATAPVVQRLGQIVVDEIRDHLVEHYGAGWVPPADEQQNLASVITDARRLGSVVVDAALAEALAENVVRVVGEYFEGMMAVSEEAVEALLHALTATPEPD